MTLVVAEIGVNHNGDLMLAKSLIDAAIRAGADVVKFQTFVADRLASPSAPLAGYQNSGNTGNQLDLLRKLELTREDFVELKRYCDDNKIEFLSTAFDFESFEFLRNLGFHRVKVGSGDLNNIPFLRAVGATQSEVLLSTGMATLEEVEGAIVELEKSGLARNLITVLQCTTAYPTEPEEANLNAMETMRDAFGVRVGFSDHTRGHSLAVAAAALGAEVIEKHLTLDVTLPGPDHFASLEPEEFSLMVDGIRSVAVGLGTGKKLPTRSELENMAIVRKSIHAAEEIAVGEPFHEGNLTVMRPGDGLSPVLWDATLGRTARYHFAKGEKIRW